MRTVESDTGIAGQACRHVAAMLLLAVTVVTVHGWSLGAGLFLDDYSHLARLQQASWQPGELIQASTLHFVGDHLKFWWAKQDLTLRYFRPVSFVIMKAQYMLCGYEPAGQHGASLAWHLVVVLVVYALGWRFWPGRWSALLAASIVAAHPGTVVAVQWIACQTELVTTALYLCGLWAWIAARQREGVCAWSSAGSEVSLSDGRQRRGSRVLLYVVAMVCYVLALGARENAITFPAVIVGYDLLCCRRWRWSWLVPVVITVGYLAVRHVVMDGFPVPPAPYVRTPCDVGFWGFVAFKLVYYLSALLAFVPVLPIAGTEFFSSRPGLVALLAAVVLGVCAWIVYPPQRRWFRVFWLGAAVVAFGPMLPVFASPHHLYLPLSFVVLAVVDRLDIAWQAPTYRRLRRAWVSVVVALLVVVAGAMVAVTGFAYRTATVYEDIVTEQTLACGDLPDDGRIYFINLPVISHSLGLALRHYTGRYDVAVHALTIAPRWSGSTSTVEATWLDDRRLQLVSRDAAWFAGPVGRVITGVVGADVPSVSRTYDADGYSVVVEDADESGVRSLVVTFDRSFAGVAQVPIFVNSSVASAMRIPGPTPSVTAGGDTDAMEVRP